MANYSLGAVWDKTQRVLRTLIQVGIPTFLSFNIVLPQIIEALGGVLPPEALLWLNGVAAVITAAAAAITRIMLIPAVNNWLANFNLSTVPAAAAEDFKVAR